MDPSEIQKTVFSTNKNNPYYLRPRRVTDNKKLKFLTVTKIKSEQTKVVKDICSLCATEDGNVEIVTQIDSTILPTIFRAHSCPDKEVQLLFCSICRDSVVRLCELYNRQADIEKEIDALVASIQTVHRIMELSSGKEGNWTAKRNGVKGVQVELDFIKIKTERVANGLEVLKEGGSQGGLNLAETDTHLILDPEGESQLYLLYNNDVENTTQKPRRRRGRKLFGCYFCSRRRSDISTLETHLILHTKEIIPFKCPTCGRSFRFKDSLKIHITVAHGTVKGKQKRNLKQRLGYKRNTRILSCYFCKRTMRFNNLPSHMRQIHTKETLLHKCEKCQKKTFSSGSLREHKKRVCFSDEGYRERLRKKHLAAKVRNQVNVNCYFCRKQIMCKVRLEKHVRGHTFEAPFYECEVCKKAFLRKDVLRRHHLEGCNKDRFTKPQILSKCKRCGQLVPSFKGHRYTCGIGVDSRKTCQVCKTSFSTVMENYLHMRMMHERGNVFKCYFCSRIFLNNSLLGKHMRSHTKENSFKCKQKTCGMFLSTSYALTIHTATQHGPLNFENRFR